MTPPTTAITNSTISVAVNSACRDPSRTLSPKTYDSPNTTPTTSAALIYVVEQEAAKRHADDAGHHVHRRANADQEPSQQHHLECVGFDRLLELLFIFGCQ